jgi:hypothetical protein
MEENLLDMAYRKRVIAQIKSDENIQRKIVSYKKQNMQEDNFHQYVQEFLETKLDPLTVKEMTIFANINLQRRISKAEASIYKKTPNRIFNVRDKKVDDFDVIYSKARVDQRLREANEAYKYQGQCAIQVYPENTELKCRVLLPHHFDVIPDSLNAEVPMAYIISNFDNAMREMANNKTRRTGLSQGNKYRDGVNQEIADYDDQATGKERYYVWSKKFNFVMNGKGEILDKETETTAIEIGEDYVNNPEVMSPLSDTEVLPFIDVSSGKNFEFWVRGWDSLYDATLIYNVILTSEFQTVEMQGHAQPYYKGDAEHMPENIRIGVDKMIFIPTNPQNPVDSEFGFANPGSDLSGIREFRESFLAAFLSSRGLDASIVSGNPSANIASSGVEKLLRMVEKFEASQEDISLFENVEDELAKIFAAYIESFRGERVDGELILADEYQITSVDYNDIGLNIQYARPEMIKTEQEMLDIASKEIEMGLSSRVHVLMQLKNMTMDEAKNHIREVDEFEGLYGSNQPA